jgi:hypothetical protein
MSVLQKNELLGCPYCSQPYHAAVTRTDVVNTFRYGCVHRPLDPEFEGITVIRNVSSCLPV